VETYFAEEKRWYSLSLFRKSGSRNQPADGGETSKACNIVAKKYDKKRAATEGKTSAARGGSQTTKLDVEGKGSSPENFDVC